LSPGRPGQKPAAVVLLIVTRGAHESRKGGALAEPSQVLSGVEGSFNTRQPNEQEEKLPEPGYSGVNLPMINVNTFLYQVKVITQDHRQVKNQVCSFNTAVVTMGRIVAPPPRPQGGLRGGR
jgi:hypothetical protein